jgi:hypothetical protein
MGIKKFADVTGPRRVRLELLKHFLAAISHLQSLHFIFFSPEILYFLFSLHQFSMLMLNKNQEVSENENGFVLHGLKHVEYTNKFN